MRTFRLATLAMTSAVLTAPAAADDQVIYEWNQLLLQTIRVTDGIPNGYPGPVSRCIAGVHTSIYDAVNSITRTHEPYLHFVDCPADTSMEAAIASAAHRAMTLLYQFAPLQQPNFDALYEEQLARIPEGPAKAAGIQLGLDCANAMFAARQGDHSNEPVVYVAGSEPGEWAPTWPDGLVAATPHWPNVTPWCLISGDQFRPPDGCSGFEDLPALLASPEYAAQLNEVKELGSLFSETRTEYESETAFFWANCRVGTYKPPGHLQDIAQVLAQDHRLDLPAQARLFALTAVASADGVIASWDTKYSTDIDLWRPIDAIWNADADGNPMTEPDPSWLSYSFSPEYGAQGAFTPPFPAWTSGHATMGASTAAVWRRFFGTDRVTFTITSDDRPEVWRTYHRFSDAALENGRSRVFFGVHFQWDCDAGYDVGTLVGDYIASNYFRRLGDLNGDGSVDGDDLGTLLGNWGASGAGDLDGNGVVDGSDLGELLGNWS